MANYDGPPVAVDVMGGDNAQYGTIVKGAMAAQTEYGIPVLLVGNRDFIAQYTTDPIFPVVHADTQVAMKAKQSKELRLPGSSIRVGLELIKAEESMSLVSAGNSGAMYMNAALDLGKISRGLEPGIATLLPRPDAEGMTILLDAGATMECKPSDLIFYGLMGAVMARKRFGIVKPRVALHSNGEEPEKGMKGTVVANQLMQAIEDSGSTDAFTFIGNVEARELMTDTADVIVAPNGFVGNTALKSLEGGSRQLINRLCKMFTQFDKEVRDKIILEIIELGISLHPETYGGAVLIGVDKGYPVISHGSSSETAIKNSVRVGAELSGSGLIEDIKTALADFPELPKQEK